MRLTSARSACLSVLLGLAAPAPAAAPAPSEQDFLGTVPVILAGTRLAQPLADAPAAVTVIDRQMIEASGAREIPELFRLVPGFQVGSPSGHQHSVTYHGLSDEFSRRMQVLVDGRSIYTPSTGGVEWTELPLYIGDIERIEVIRGPNAATHGANAFLGVISIVTRHSSQAPGTRLTLNRGGNGVADAWLQHGGRARALTYQTSLGFVSDDGFDTRNDTKQLRVARLRGDYQLGLRDTLSLRVGYSEGRREVGFPRSPSHLPDHTDRQTSFQHLRWTRYPSAGEETVVQLYHTHEKLEETREGLAIMPVSAHGRTHRYDLEAYRIRRLGDDARAIWGASLRHDALRGPLEFGTRKTLRDQLYRLFANLEWRARPRLLVNAGLMWEHHRISGSDLSPRLALNYQLAPSHTLRASISKALRTPLRFEIQGDLRVPLRSPPAPPGTLQQLFRGNPGLQPERILSRELGYVMGSAGGRLSLDLKLFHDSLDRLVGTRLIGPPPGTLQWENQDSVTIRGAELHVQIRPTRRSRLVLSHGYADADSVDQSLQRSTPEHTFSALGILDLSPQWQASAGYYVVGEQQWLGEGDRVPMYRRLDLRLRRSFGWSKDQGHVAMVIQNALGEHLDFRNDANDPRRRNVRDTQAYVQLEIPL